MAAFNFVLQIRRNDDENYSGQQQHNKNGAKYSEYGSMHFQFVGNRAKDYE